MFRIGGREIVEIDAAGPFVVKQRAGAVIRLHFLQLLDLSRRERAGVVAVGALSACRIKGRQPAQMHRPADRVLLAGAAIGRRQDRSRMGFRR